MFAETEERSGDSAGLWGLATLKRQWPLKLLFERAKPVTDRRSGGAVTVAGQASLALGRSWRAVARVGKREGLDPTSLAQSEKEAPERKGPVELG